MGYFMCDERTTVATAKGRVKGLFSKDLYMFKGIPYAQAERWEQPREMDAWEGVFDATNYGYVCPLMNEPKPDCEIKVPHRYWPQSENCLNLNIWTPGLDTKRRPVLVWLHGGALQAGSSIEQQVYEGENLASKGDVVVVSLNHRLNIIGFLDMSFFGPEYENSGNIGIADMTAALRWVHENIELFGGDPDNVTIMGQSGGGVKTTLLLQYPEADGLFHKVFNMSGVDNFFLYDADEKSHQIAKDLAEALGCKTMEEMKKVEYSKLVSTFLDLKAKYVEELGQSYRHMGCIPTRNSHYIGNPAWVGFRPETAHIPVMIGTVFGEFTGFDLPKYDKTKMTYEEGVEAVREKYGDLTETVMTAFEAAYPDRHPVDLLAIDTVFRPGNFQYLDKRSALNNCTYNFIFDEDFDLNGRNVPWHCCDIPFWFGNTELAPVCNQPWAKELEDKMFRALITFARTGSPSHLDLPDWKACEPGKLYTMLLGKEPHLECNHDRLVIETALKVTEQGKVNFKKVQH